MTKNSLAQLSDRDLLDATARTVDRDRRTTAELLALLAELDVRKLYLGEGYSSLFTYCMQALHLSEPAAYGRITAARAARRFPIVLTRLAEGDITLTTVGLLAPHFTDENYQSLLDAARHQSKREVERLVACLHPQPDIPPSIRRLPAPTTAAATAAPVPQAAPPSVSLAMTRPAPDQSRRSVVAPLAPERYLMRITIGADTHRKLQRACDLLRHAIPDGDPAAVVDRALSVLLEQLERRKVAKTTRPRRASRPTPTRSRRIPAEVRRSVWRRDQGRCAFVGTQGRCHETGFLEFHHVRPFAAGGATDIDNLQLRCRAHNAHEAHVYFGDQLRPDGVDTSSCPADD